MVAGTSILSHGGFVMTLKASQCRPALALVALGLLITHATQAVAQPAKCGSQVRTAKVNGTTLHYTECGRGEPLVFVHGALGDLQTFNGQLDAFAAEYRVIAYSRRFHPPNAPPAAGAVNALQDHIDDLLALLRTLGASPAHLVGNSSGAYVVLAFAMQHPEAVRSLVLGEPPVFSLLGRTSVGSAALDSWNSRVLSPTRRAFQSGDSVEAMRRFLDGISGAPVFDQLPQPARARLMTYAPEFRSEMLTEPSRYLPPLACNALGQLKRPILLVSGERSPAMLLLITGELERCLGGESHVMVPEAGHGMHGDNPAFYNQSVLGFLRRK
jgi:pimeloyl-ACP methyl ester carboxylesterase